MSRRLFAILTASLGLVACDLKMDSADLTARSQSTQAGLACNACHAYVLSDSNHQFHLFRIAPQYDINGPATCLECHAGAIQAHDTVFLDSVFFDADSNG